MRSSWVLTPALRNLYFRRALLESASIMNRCTAESGELAEVHTRELCAAAAELYHHLQTGHFKTSSGQRRAIAGDMAKLRYAENLSEKARLLERNMRQVSSQLGGVQEVRTKIGNALLGARVVYGEPLFITVSPSSRHSGLVLRLSRVRVNDPTLRLEDMALEEARQLGSGPRFSILQAF